MKTAWIFTIISFTPRITFCPEKSKNEEGKISYGQCFRNEVGRRDPEVQKGPADSGRDCLATEGHKYIGFLQFTWVSSKREETL